MDLLIATTNPGKMREIRQYLTGYRILTLADLGILRRAPETGASFAEIAREKALFYSGLCPGILVCAEDSGLEVSALNGRPGILSARFEENHPGDPGNRIKLLRLMTGRTDRRARFVARVALARDRKILREFSGKVAGTISDRPVGSKGFGYDPVFFYPPLQKTFAQLSTAEKNRISHRKKAFTGVRKYLAELSFPPDTPS